MQAPSIPTRLFPFMIHFLKPYKLYIAAMLLVSLLYAVHTATLPYVLKLFIDRISSPHTSVHGIYELLTWPAVGYVGLSLFLGLLFRFYNYILMKLIPNLKRDVQHAMFAYLERHSHTYFQNQFAGSLSNKVMDMTRGSAEILQLFMMTCVDPIFSISIALFAMSQVHSIFSLIFGIFAILFISLSWFLAKKCQPLSTTYSEARSTTSGKIVDSISNMMTVRLFSNHWFENHYLRGYTDDVVAKDRAVHRYLIFARLSLTLTINIMLGFLIWALIWANAHALITPGDFVLILTLTHRILDMLWNVTNQFVQLFQEVGTSRQALNILTQVHELKDAPLAPSILVDRGDITFEDVKFGYDKSIIFEHLNIRIHGGSKIGLVGFSGAGKTTFTHLILRLFDVDSGKILIDDQDISQVTQDSLRRSISMIPQDTTLFHRTLMDNIRYGRLDASDEAVIAAATQAHCHDFIAQLPEGYQSLVGERGIKLSGGQRQRIAIARAMLKNAPILILDEATSSLDSVTEGLIQDSLSRLIQGRTTIVIAHRLSTLSQMDRLLVFHQGRIVQDGHHDQLVGVPGQYQKLWTLQANGFLPD